MSGAIPPLPNTPSWHGAPLKKKAQGQLYIYLLPTSLKTSRNFENEDQIQNFSVEFQVTDMLWRNFPTKAVSLTSKRKIAALELWSQKLYFLPQQGDVSFRMCDVHLCRCFLSFTVSLTGKRHRILYTDDRSGVSLYPLLALYHPLLMCHDR
jgi:hypothetical protein